MTPVNGEAIPQAVVARADALAKTVANQPLFQHTSVFVPDAARDGLVLAAQRWGPFDETGDVRAGSWVAGFAALPGCAGRLSRFGRLVASAPRRLC